MIAVTYVAVTYGRNLDDNPKKIPEQTNHGDSLHPVDGDQPTATAPTTTSQLHGVPVCTPAGPRHEA